MNLSKSAKCTRRLAAGGEFPINKIQRKQQSSFVQNCKWCGGSHKRLKTVCPAYGSTCSACKKKNHFKKVCKSSRRETVNQMDSESEGEDEEYLYSIKSKGKSKKLSANVIFKIQNTNKLIKCELDTGATTNVTGAED